MRKLIDAAAFTMYVVITLMVAGYFEKTPDASFSLCLLAVLTGSLLSIKAGRKLALGY